MPVKFLARSSIGVIEIFGIIGGGAKVQAQAQLIDQVRRDRNFKAVVVDIDSPGGSAAASEVLYRSLRRTAQDKPVVAYVRGTGASGAYYLASAANIIMALPSALVGSIGVIYMRPVIQDLLERMGVRVNVFSAGRLKGMTGFWRSPTSEEESKFQDLISQVYDNFVESVSEGRKMPADQVRELATGEIFTAKTALEKGLIDRLGDFDDALEAAAELGKTKPRPVWVRPKRGVMDRFAGRLAGPAVSLEPLTELAQLMSGGVYYIAPGYGPVEG